MRKDGANTKVGLIFEEKVGIKQVLEKIEGYKIEPASTYKGNNIKKKGKIYSIAYNDRLV